eukprot:m.74899 g.74899  ORF g.74899 m.74899 type:complete len:775 (+) comp20469_c0_seq1:49-2373(+)
MLLLWCVCVLVFLPLSSWGQIANVQPNEGVKGTTVTITGTGLRGGDNFVDFVLLDGVEATMVSESDTEVVVIAGNSNTPNTGDVELYSDFETLVSSTGVWTYLAKATFDSMTPSTGVAGTKVELVGTGLLGGGSSVGSVSMNGFEQLDFSIDIGTLTETLTFTVCDCLASGVYKVEIIADTGAQSNSTLSWTHIARAEPELPAASTSNYLFENSTSAYDNVNQGVQIAFYAAAGLAFVFVVVAMVLICRRTGASGFRLFPSSAKTATPEQKRRRKVVLGIKFSALLMLLVTWAYNAWVIAVGVNDIRGFFESEEEDVATYYFIDNGANKTLRQQFILADSDSEILVLDGSWKQKVTFNVTAEPDANGWLPTGMFGEFSSKNDTVLIVTKLKSTTLTIPYWAPKNETVIQKISAGGDSDCSITEPQAAAGFTEGTAFCPDPLNPACGTVCCDGCEGAGCEFCADDSALSMACCPAADEATEDMAVLSMFILAGSALTIVVDLLLEIMYMFNEDAEPTRAEEIYGYASLLFNFSLVIIVAVFFGSSSGASSMMCFSCANQDSFADLFNMFRRLLVALVLNCSLGSFSFGLSWLFSFDKTDADGDQDCFRQRLRTKILSWLCTVPETEDSDISPEVFESSRTSRPGSQKPFFDTSDQEEIQEVRDTNQDTMGETSRSNSNGKKIKSALIDDSPDKLIGVKTINGVEIQRKEKEGTMVFTSQAMKEEQEAHKANSLHPTSLKDLLEHEGIAMEEEQRAKDNAQQPEQEPDVMETHLEK